MLWIFALPPATFLLIFFLWLYSAGVGFLGMAVAAVSLLLSLALTKILLKRLTALKNSRPERKCAAAVVVLGLLLFLAKLVCFGPHAAAGATVALAVELWLGFALLNGLLGTQGTKAKKRASNSSLSIENIRHEHYRAMASLKYLVCQSKALCDREVYSSAVALSLYLKEALKNGTRADSKYLAQVVYLANSYLALVCARANQKAPGELKDRLKALESDALELYEKSCLPKLNRINSVIENIDARIRLSGLAPSDFERGTDDCNA